MLGADGLNLALMVAESGMIDSAVREIMQHTEFMGLGNEDSVKQSLTASMAKWTQSVKRKLVKTQQTDSIQAELNLYQYAVYLTESEFDQNVEDIIEKLPQDSLFRDKANQLLASKHTYPSSLFARQFCTHWYASLKGAVEDKQQVTLEQQKSRFLKQLYQRIDTLKDMENLTQSGENAQLGRLWDLAGAELTKQDWKSIEQTADYLAKHSELTSIADKLGRMAEEVDAPELNRVESHDDVVVEEKSDFATDDIVGIHTSNDINKLLPNETMYLAYPELETVFYQHLVEKRLLTYKAEGKQRTIRQLHAPTQSHGEATKEKGPMLIAVDVSGSMQGAPEKSAKAMAYALMKMAAEQQRDCHVILFSSTFITYDLSGSQGLKEACDFLSYTFKGGTDLTKVLNYAVDIMQGEQYKNADLLVISDFIAPKQEQETIENMLVLKGCYNRFHSLCLSKYGNPELLSLFDSQWRYHPSLMGKIVKKPTVGFHRARQAFSHTFG
ncbi:ATPase RavA stimulator ViaA [Vibrio wakamikoensis]|uniref:ATPase RavA stimulator ViaA n=1 Tax=Vibrio TaxID=662 RepID=UPI003AB7B57E